MHASTLVFGLSAVAAAQALSFSDVTQYVGKSIKLPRSISGWSSQEVKRDGNTGGWVTPERFGQSGRDFDPNNWPTGPHSSNCPAVWTDVAKELQGLMTDNGQCNDFARAAIRAAFHDCFAGGCDGSLYLAQEYLRFENVGLQDAVPKIGALAEKYQVGVADMIQFAGASGIVICPMGPRIQTYVGRKDSSVPSVEGQLPSVHGAGDALLAQFAAKGFTATDLAALIGAHTTSKMFNVDPSQAGKPQDTTPGTWDVLYYSQTLDNTAPFRFESDINLANQAQVGPVFKSFVNNQFGWAAAFAPAMTKMSLLGIDGGAASLTDCTSSLPFGTARRDVRNAPIAGRV